MRLDQELYAEGRVPLKLLSNTSKALMPVQALNSGGNVPESLLVWHENSCKDVDQREKAAGRVPVRLFDSAANCRNDVHAL